MLHVFRMEALEIYPDFLIINVDISINFQDIWWDNTVYINKERDCDKSASESWFNPLCGRYCNIYCVSPFSLKREGWFFLSPSPTAIATKVKGYYMLLGGSAEEEKQIGVGGKKEENAERARPDKHNTSDEHLHVNVKKNAAEVWSHQEAKK